MLTFIRKILNLHDYPMCSLLLILKMSSSLRTKKKQCCTLVHIIFQIVIYIENFLKSYKNLKKYLSFFCKKKKDYYLYLRLEKCSTPYLHYDFSHFVICIEVIISWLIFIEIEFTQ